MFGNRYKLNSVRTQYEKSDTGRLVRDLNDGWVIADVFSVSDVRTFVLKWPWWRLKSPPGMAKGVAVKV